MVYPAQNYESFSESDAIGWFFAVLRLKNWGCGVGWIFGRNATIRTQPLGPRTNSKLCKARGTYVSVTTSRYTVSIIKRMLDRNTSKVRR